MLVMALIKQSVCHSVRVRSTVFGALGLKLDCKSPTETNAISPSKTVAGAKDQVVVHYMFFTIAVQIRAAHKEKLNACLLTVAIN